jgi:hypothetical protein
VNAGGDPRQGTDDLGIDLAGIRLARQAEGFGKSKSLRDHAVQGLDLGMVAVKQGEE